jgi:hypothetical protein
LWIFQFLYFNINVWWYFCFDELIELSDLFILFELSESILCFLDSINSMIDWLIWLFDLNLVYEIVAQREPHKDENVLEVAVLIRWVNQTQLNSSNNRFYWIDLFLFCLRPHLNWLNDWQIHISHLFYMSWFELFDSWVILTFETCLLCLILIVWLFELTEIKDWHQRFHKIVLQFFEKWWKCVGRKIPINVLYPFIWFYFHSFYQFKSITLLKFH